MHNQAVNSLALISARADISFLRVLSVLTTSYLCDIRLRFMNLRAIQQEFHDGSCQDYFWRNRLRIRFRCFRQLISFPKEESICCHARRILCHQHHGTHSTYWLVPCLPTLHGTSALSSISTFRACIAERLASFLDNLRGEYLWRQRTRSCLVGILPNNVCMCRYPLFGIYDRGLRSFLLRWKEVHWQDPWQFNSRQGRISKPGRVTLTVIDRTISEPKDSAEGLQNLWERKFTFDVHTMILINFRYPTYYLRPDYLRPERLGAGLWAAGRAAEWAAGRRAAGRDADRPAGWDAGRWAAGWDPERPVAGRAAVRAAGRRDVGRDPDRPTGWGFGPWEPLAADFGAVFRRSVHAWRLKRYSSCLKKWDKLDSELIWRHLPAHRHLLRRRDGKVLQPHEYTPQPSGQVEPNPLRG